MKLVVEQDMAVVMIEYEGHGKSDGLLGYVDNWDVLVEDCSQFFQQSIEEIRSDHYGGGGGGDGDANTIPCFLMGSSMGGAVAYYIYQRKLIDVLQWCCVHMSHVQTF